MKALLLATVSAVAFTTFAAPAMAEQGDWLFRLRAITVQPDESADISAM